MANSINKPSAEAPREMKPIPKDAVHIESSGVKRKSFEVTLPAEMTFTDIQNDPTLWRTIQDSPNAISARDHVTVFTHDGTQCLSTVCLEADRTRVVLAISPHNKITFPAGATWEDDTYKTAWEAGRVVVRRKADDVKAIGATFDNVDQARHAVFTELYSRRPAA